MSELPKIDISSFLVSSDSEELSNAQERCTKSLAHACLHHGFFYLTGHRIPEELTNHVLSLARAFFNRPPEEKARIQRLDPGVGNGDGARGYQVMGSNVTQGRRDWHEGLDLYREWQDSRDEVDQEEWASPSPPFTLLGGLNLWPDTPTEFRQVYTIYIERMLALGSAVVRAMGHSLGLSDPETFLNATKRSFWVMRAIGYPPLQTSKSSAAADSEGISCGAHTDYGCLTILLADETRGALQVQARTNPEQWINAEPVPGAFVVNIGDMMERWTNGLWKSTRHRVVHRGEGYRVSVPFFYEPDYHAVVEPLPECVERTGGLAKWEKMTYGKHLESKVSGNFY